MAISFNLLEHIFLRHIVAEIATPSACGGMARNDGGERLFGGRGSRFRGNDKRERERQIWDDRSREWRMWE